MFNMKDNNGLIVLRQLSETSYLLGRARGGLFIVGLLLQNAVDLFDTNPTEAKKYITDALKELVRIKKDIYESRNLYE